jgi:hypothetical protein
MQKVVIAKYSTVKKRVSQNGIYCKGFFILRFNNVGAVLSCGIARLEEYCFRG